ncbi:MAG: ion transporter, partial [Candidatus Hydrothermarchaeales archaeon]
MISADRKSRIFQILEIAEENDSFSKIFDVFIMSLISLNVIAVILETVEGLTLKYAAFFFYFEVASVTIFSIEYILRVWSSTSDDRFKNPING